jgi:hypothetical protein
MGAVALIDDIEPVVEMRPGRRGAVVWFARDRRSFLADRPHVPEHVVKILTLPWDGDDGPFYVQIDRRGRDVYGFDVPPSVVAPSWWLGLVRDRDIARQAADLRTRRVVRPQPELGEQRAS